LIGQAQNIEFLKALRADLKPVAFGIFEALVVGANPNFQLCAEKAVTHVYTRTAEDFLEILPYLSKILPGNVVPHFNLEDLQLIGGNATYHPCILFLHALKAMQRSNPNATFEDLKIAILNKEKIKLGPDQNWFYLDSPKGTEEFLMKVGEEFERVKSYLQADFERAALNKEAEYKSLTQKIDQSVFKERMEPHMLAASRIGVSEYIDALQKYTSSHPGFFMSQAYAHITGTDEEGFRSRPVSELKQATYDWLRSEKIYAGVLIPKDKDGCLILDHRFVNEDMEVIFYHVKRAKKAGLNDSEIPALSKMIDLYTACQLAHIKSQL
jgi:hypothetical protein